MDPRVQNLVLGYTAFWVIVIVFAKAWSSERKRQRKQALLNKVADSISVSFELKGRSTSPPSKVKVDGGYLINPGSHIPITLLGTGIGVDSIIHALKRVEKERSRTVGRDLEALMREYKVSWKEGESIPNQSPREIACLLAQTYHSLHSPSTESLLKSIGSMSAEHRKNFIIQIQCVNDDRTCLTCREACCQNYTVDAVPKLPLHYGCRCILTASKLKT